MKIVKLEAENVKRLRAVSITPDGAVVRIQGANGAGKSSVLDAIAYALGGEKLCPAKPIRRGATKARVLVELDEDLVVERRWSEGGSRLEVRTKNGLKHPSPQRLLDSLVGRLSFDPLEFLRLAPKNQAETLRALSGVDLSAFDEGRRLAYEKRTGWNRQVAQVKARLATMPEVDAPDVLLHSADLLAEHERRQKEIEANAKKKTRLSTAQDDLRAMTKRAVNTADALEDLRAQVAETEKRLEDQTAEIGRMALEERGLAAEVEALVDPDMAEIPARLRVLEETNDRVRAKKARADVEAELVKAETNSEELGKAIDLFDAQKAEVLAAAQFPVAGLGFTEDGVTLQGLPLEQASSAEQLRVSLAMSIALNPKLRVMLIRDGSLLDETSLAAVAKMAEETDCQVWLEMVAPGATSGIVIEDGAVVGAEVEEEAEVAS